MKILLTILLIAVLAAGGAAAWLWYSLTQPYQGFAAEGVFVDVPHGASRRTVARLLEQNGVIQSALAFEIYARRHPKRTLQAGEYFFNSAAAGKDVFWKVARGDVYSQPFTVREGETMYDIARDLEAGKFMTMDDFLQAANDPTMVRDIAPHAHNLEGFLYPATYNLPRHPAANELAAQMVARFKNEWSRIAQGALTDKSMTADGKPVVSVVALASLVERETPKPDERPLVAGVFENRLRLHMPLQCDSTVVYALERTGEYSGTLTLNDLRVDSPYNTYANRGLPPGPIGNPGDVALRAALTPAQTNYLYFVANTQGGHFFSATLAEHNKNVQKYHRLLAGLPADPPEEEAVPVKKKQPQKKATKRKPAHHKAAARHKAR
jgi:peptidoglycan lytic transglycosylase G